MSAPAPLLAADAAAFLGALVAMEGVAWLMHRFVMHGPLWSLHKSHHEPRRGPGLRHALELNDLFAVLFAALAIALFLLGRGPAGNPLWWAAAGVSAYGLLYALFHDGVVHRRWPLRIALRGGWLERLVRAHHIHHATLTRTGAVSFGFLAPRDVERLARELRRRRGRPA